MADTLEYREWQERELQIQAKISENAGDGPGIDEG